jgi:gliding motility-associated-like protein
MKKLITIIILTASCFVLNAQSYKIDVFNNDTIINCSGNGIFYDSGGQFGNYSPNENYTITFCPTAGSGQAVNIDFTTFSLGTSDELCAFNGANTSAPLMGCFSSVNSAFSLIASNATGCITFTFTSNGFNQSDGWEASVTCQTSCQTVEADIVSTIPAMIPVDTGYIDICEGDVVTFTGAGLYPQNNTNYAQSNATSTFRWLIEGQQFFGQTVTHTFNNSGGYNVVLEVTDNLGCKNTNSANARVRVAPPPTFTGTNASPTTVCLGDTVDLIGNVIPGVEGFISSLTRGDSIFLPDGTNVCYQTTLQFTDFLPGQTLTNINDFESVCVNMEHSWIGDLDLFLTCPNGTQVTLHPFGAGGGGTKLGEPVLFGTSPGKGYDYCWTPTATQTWAQAINTGTGITTVNGQQTLISGDYASNSPMSALVGCPLNGQWEIEICDNLAVDNGYIFNWGLEFAPSLYPNVDTFIPQYTAHEWELADGTIIPGKNASYTTTTVGTTTNTYRVTNDFGCTHDTTIDVTVIGPPAMPSLSCFSTNATQITVMRSTVPNAISYEINAGNGGWQTMTNNTFTVSGLNPVQSVFFQVRAIGPAGCDLESEIDTITCTTADCQLSINLNSLTQVSCIGAADGAAVLSATTNLMPLTYTIDGITTNNTGSFSNLTVGSHTVVVQDGNTCQDSITFNITSPIVMNINATANNVSCNGGNDGFATVAVSGGSAPYSFLWNNTGNTGTIIDLIANDYIVTVTDNNGCAQSDTVTITEPSALQLSFQKTDVSCFNGNDGTATVNVSGGTPNYTYNWSTFPVQTTQTVTNLSSNLYNVTVTDGNSCTMVGDTTITEPTMLTLAIDTNRVTCFGAMDGEGIPTVGGGTAPYSYLWSNGDTNQIADTLGGGFHSLTVTDSLGCMVTTNFGIYEPTQITNSFTTQQVTCFGLSDGWASVTAAGGVGSNYTYQWSLNTGSQTGQFANNLSGGTYAVTTRDMENCSVVNTVFVLAPVLVFVDTMYSTPAICHYSNEGTVGTAGSGGSGILTYNWDNGQTGTNLTNLTRGQYTVTIADVNGCVGIDSVIVDSPDSIEIAFTTTPLFCGNDGTGTASAAVIGGISQYDYAWNTTPTNTTNSLTSLQAGIYTLTVTDDVNCIQVDSVEVFEPDPLLATTTYVEPLCFGDGNGSARIFATGGNGGNTFSWVTTPIQTDTTAINLTAGTYNYTVIDSNNCTFNGSVTVTEPPFLVSSSFGVNITCRDAADGIVTVTTTGGTYPYNYNWSSSTQNDSVISSLDTGWHYVTITDFFGCTTLDSVYLTQPDYITTSITSTNLSCFESSDGTATITASGGVGNYTYLWSNNNQTGTTATGLDAGWNSVTVTDGNGCQAADSVLLTEPTEIALLGLSTLTLCYADNSGTASIVASGGTAPYFYSWATTPVQTSSTATNLFAGTYSVTVTDAQNCSRVDSVQVDEPNELVINFVKTDMSCFELENGTIDANPSGGTPNYTYNWSNSQGSKNVFNLDKGTYTVSVTDANGCESIDSTTILEPTLLTSTTLSYPSSCFNGSDGSAVVNANGGTPDINGRYNYLWNATFPQTTDSAVSLVGGQSYTVIITDNNGCTDTSKVTINQPSQIIWTTDSTETSCYNSLDGTASVTGLGGVGGFSYYWDISANGQVGTTADSLGKGNYFVTIQDGNGCQQKTNIVVTGPEPIEINAISASIVCKGDSTGDLFSNVAGGSGIYTYQWDANTNNQTASNAVDLKAGTYLLTVTDDNGCEGVDSFEVLEPAFDLNSDLTKSDIQCFGKRNGEVVVNTTGGTMPYEYSLDQINYDAANALTGLYADDYVIYTKDGNGCETVDSIQIFEPAPFSVLLPFDTTVDVGTDVQIFPVLDNGVAPFTYEWQPQDTTLTCWDCPNPTTVDLLYERVFILQVTDASGCVSTDEMTVRINQDRAIYVATGFTPNNDGVNDALFVQGTQQIVKVNYFQVYNRWGELVFKNKDFAPNVDVNGWDGYFKGDKAPNGVYGWVLEVEFIDGEIFQLQGNTTLIW